MAITRKELVFLVLGGFFITNALLGELIGVKVIGDPSWRLGTLGPFLMSVGVIPWPVVFITTDLTNEYFGRRGVRLLTFLTVLLIGYAFLILLVTMQIEGRPEYGVDDHSYNTVFGQSRWIIIGSVTAFLVSQLVDVVVFHALRARTGKSMLWLRATGSTVVSQLIDSFIVLYIGLAYPRQWDFETYAASAAASYSTKLAIAVAITPLVYLGHWGVEKFLGKTAADDLASAAAARDAGAGTRFL